LVVTSLSPSCDELCEVTIPIATGVPFTHPK
jgi:hypothetical protein